MVGGVSIFDKKEKTDDSDAQEGERTEILITVGGWRRRRSCRS